MSKRKKIKEMTMHDECCDSDSETKFHKHNKKGVDLFIVGLVLFTIVLLGGAFYFGSKSGETTQVNEDTQVSLAVGDSRHDWGVIDINGGLVSKSFPIENKGSSPLKLFDVKTSCMCTTAQLKTNDQLSRKFGMHDKASSVFEVNPGETAELIVEFDPLFHGPSGVGVISRTITVNTNDPQKPTLSFQLTANVVKQ